jgi:uncharacterized coiled-coil protein SlyX
MATATQAKLFNYDLFKKRVRLFDSDSDGERNLAFTQALRQCVEHTPPLKFHEAASQAFGFDGGKLAAALDRVTQLESEITRLEDAGETLANALAEQQEINAELQETIDRLQAELQNRQGIAHGSANAGFPTNALSSYAVLKWLLRKIWPPIIWNWPNLLTVLLGADSAIAWVWINVRGSEMNVPAVLMYIIWFRVALLTAWIVLIDRRQGRGVLIVKSSLWLVMWWSVVIATNLLNHVEVADYVSLTPVNVAMMLAPVFWWCPLLATFHAVPIVLIALMGLFVVVRLSLSEFSEAFLGLLKRLGEQ